MTKLKHHVLVLVCAGRVVSSLFVAAAAQAQDVSFVGARQEYGVAIAPYSVVVGDFNRDGVTDMAVVSQGTRYIFQEGSVSVLLGNGDGTFQETRNFDVVGSPQSIAVGDFNGDEVEDLVVAAYPSSVSVLLGHGDGTFQAPRSVFTGYSPSAVAVGDFNRDGAKDLAIANRYAYGSVVILLGNGDGTFQPERNFQVGSGPVSIAVGDLNGDGVEDLAVGRFCTTPRCYVGFASVLLGNGDGSFQPVRDYFVGRGAGRTLWWRT